jgi:hypothetical protein
MATTVSQIDAWRAARTEHHIAATMDAGKIKLADPTLTSTRYRSYVPFWA